MLLTQINVPVFFIVLLIPVGFIIHELEEWNILDWYKKHYRNLPSSTNRSIRLWIAFICIVISLLTLIAYFLIIQTIVFSIIIIFISFFMFVNTIQHIIWTIQYKDYSPGLITALLMICIVILANYLLLRKGLINNLFYFIGTYSVLPIWKTIKSPNEMTSEIRGIHTLGIRLEKEFNKYIKD